MKYSQVTIKDLAKELGISPSTVSRALKDHPDISRATKKAVHELAEKLNYQPNIVALSLRSRKTRTLGVVIPEVVHFFFSTVIAGIEQEAQSAGYSVILTQSAENLDKERSSLRTLFNSRVDGFLISISRNTTQFDHIDSILEKNLPVVFFDRHFPKGNVHEVLVDDRQGAQQAVQHLIDQGCKRIAHICSAPNLEISRQRLLGYKDVLEGAGIKVDPSYIIECSEGSVEAGRAAMQELLKNKNTPDGIFANNDVLAFGASHAIKQKGLKIPKDIAVIGFSNWLYSEMMDPALSSVDQPGLEMGRQAARLLIRQIERDEDAPRLAPETITLPTRVVIRASSLRKPV